MSVDAEKDLITIVNVLWSIIQGFATIKIGIMASWPEYFDPKHFHKYIHDKGYINDIMVGTAAVMLLFLFALPVIIIFFIYPAEKFGEEYCDTLGDTWRICTVTGLVLGVIWV